MMSDGCKLCSYFELTPSSHDIFRSCLLSCPCIPLTPTDTLSPFPLSLAPKNKKSAPVFLHSYVWLSIYVSIYLSVCLLWYGAAHLYYGCLFISLSLSLSLSSLSLSIPLSIYASRLVAPLHPSLCISIPS